MDPRVNKLSYEDAISLKEFAEKMGGLDTMPAWMRDEVEKKIKEGEKPKDLYENFSG